MAERLIIDAHSGCTNNRKTLGESSRCGCFSCLRIFGSEKITDWIPEEKNGEEVTALCPYCGIDSVIPETVEYPLSREFLEGMKEYWFGK